MRPPADPYLIHTRDRIAFGPIGLLELTLAQVEALQAFHMSALIKAVLLGDLPSADHHRAAERVFCRAMEDHSRHHMGRKAA